MAIEVMCPSCNKRQTPAIRVQAIQPSAKERVARIHAYDPRRSMLILLLTLSIVGLPIAYWLCKRDEAAYPLGERTKLKYSYQCSLCGYAWSRIREEEALEAPTPQPERRTQPALTAAGEKSQV